MSYVVSTSTAAFCRGQDHPGSVPVPGSGVTAVRALESSFGQPEAPLGSRKTLRAGHCRVGGRNEHHLPGRLRATFDQFPLRRPDRSISGLARHRGLCQEQRLEVLDGDGLVVVHDRPGPDTARVGVLPGGFLVELRRLPARALIALRLGLPALTLTTRHPALRPGQLGSTALAVPAVGQVVGRIGCGGRGGDAPVDADTGSGFRCWLSLASDDERCMPVPEGILRDADARRVGRKLAGPDDRDADTFGQDQPAVADAEPTGGVLQAGQRHGSFLSDWLTAALDLERVIEGEGVSAESLLLSDLRPVTQPAKTAAGLGEHLGQAAERRTGPGSLLVNGLVPEEPAAVPLVGQRAFRHGAGAQAVGVAHCLVHAKHYTAQTCIVSTWTRSGQTTTSCTAAPTASSGALSTGGRSSKVLLTCGCSRSSAMCAAIGTRRSSSWRRCPTMCTCSSAATRSTGFTGWSSRSRAGRRGCSARSSRTCAPGCPPSGPTLTSSPRSAARPWRSSSVMSRTSGTPEQARPFLPMAEARGFAGGF